MQPAELIITTCRHPPKSSIDLVCELMKIFPRATYCERQKLNFHDIVALSSNQRNILLCEGFRRVKKMVFLSAYYNQKVSFKLSNLEFHNNIVNFEYRKNQS